MILHCSVWLGNVGVVAFMWMLRDTHHQPIHRRWSCTPPLTCNYAMYPHWRVSAWQCALTDCHCCSGIAQGIWELKLSTWSGLTSLAHEGKHLATRRTQRIPWRYPVVPDTAGYLQMLAGSLPSGSAVAIGKDLHDLQWCLDEWCVPSSFHMNSVL